jgi:beta-lactamase class A
MASSLRLRALGAGAAIVFALSAQSLASALEAAGVYRVEPGDTLGAIRAATGIPIDRLTALNNLTDPNLIVAGQELRLRADDKASGEQVAAAAGAEHVVQEGESLWEIANRAGVSLQALAEINQIANVDQLTVGQRLRLPAAAPAPATGAATTGRSATAASAQTRASTSASLRERVLAEARRVGGANVQIGVAAKNLVTGEQIGIRADESFASASVMKLPILVELERQVANGTLNWTDSLWSQASAMMTVSDNIAANRLYDLLGHGRVNETMAKLGLTGTRLANRFSDARTQGPPGQNRTTPADMAELLELIATDQLISAKASADMRALLEQSTDRSKLARLLPPGTRVAHKSGWYEGIANDVGIVTPSQGGARWVIAVFAEGLPDAETGNQLIAVVSHAVYQSWAK